MENEKDPRDTLIEAQMELIDSQERRIASAFRYLHFENPKIKQAVDELFYDEAGLKSKVQAAEKVIKGG